MQVSDARSVDDTRRLELGAVDQDVRAADPQVAARVDDPSRRVQAVELALAVGARECVEDPLGQCRDQALEAEVPVHPSRST
jgi:hypothetical protein